MKPHIRQKFIVGNWKMHTTAADATRLAKAIVDGISIMSGEDRVSVAVCPPFPYLALVGEILKGSCVALGAQNLYPEKDGAFTGEVSPTMLLDLGCKYVILGHSERRRILGESDAFINQKVRVALTAGLNVILCVGETLDQRKAEQTEAVLDRQLTQGLADVLSGDLTRMTIAYEPLWAIGNLGHHATPQQAQDSARPHSTLLLSHIRGKIGSSSCHTVRWQRQTGKCRLNADPSGRRRRSHRRRKSACRSVSSYRPSRNQ